MRKIHYTFLNDHLFCIKNLRVVDSISMPCNLTTKSSYFLFDSSQKQVAFVSLIYIDTHFRA